MVIVLASATLSRPDRREGGGRAAAPSAPAGAGGSQPAAALQSASEGAQRLDAVRTVKLFC
ncbi:MAG: hypothetical protein IMZ74_17390, partial [Actinobacteria bacterium]|nr:hypothetical protein [Actinomycetota bacterium]